MLDPEARWSEEDLTLNECEDSFLTIERLRRGSPTRRRRYLGRRSSRVADALLRALSAASSAHANCCTSFRATSD